MSIRLVIKEKSNTPKVEVKKVVKEEKLIVFTKETSFVKVPIKEPECSWNSNWVEGDPLKVWAIPKNLNIVSKYFNLNTGVDNRLIVETTDDKYLLVVKVNNSHSAEYITVDNTSIDPTRIRKTISLEDFNRKKTLERYVV